MAGKNKGGREVRKPKQDKKTKDSSASSVIPTPTVRQTGRAAK